MAWGIDGPLFELAQRLVDTRLRVERLQLAQRLKNLEARLSHHGLPTKDIKDLRKSFKPAPNQSPDRVDRALVLPSKPEGVWRRRYLNAVTKPGSVF